MYTARFEFDIPTTGKVQLEVQMGRPSTAGELYEITQSQWTRKSEKVEAVHPIEVFMIRLLGFVLHPILLMVASLTNNGI